MKLINPSKAEGIIERYDAWIGQVAERYHWISKVYDCFRSR
jgi:hypothetical protein